LATPLAQTWEYDGLTWHQVTTVNAPPPRFGPAVAYDAWRGRTILFGGDSNGGASFLQDTWEYDGVNWRQLPTSATPESRGGHGPSFDLEHGPPSCSVAWVWAT